MARGWRLNPPPQWPPLPGDLRPGPDWSPDPSWGPAPPGWTLWEREPRAAWLRRHKTTAGLGGGALVLVAAAVAAPAATHLTTGGTPSAPFAAGSATPGAAAHEPRLDPSVRRPAREASRSRELQARATPTGTPDAHANIARYEVNGTELTPRKRWRPGAAPSAGAGGGFGAQAEPEPSGSGRPPRCGSEPADPAEPSATPQPAPTGDAARDADVVPLGTAAPGSGNGRDHQGDDCDDRTPRPTASEPAPGDEPPGDVPPWWPEAAGKGGGAVPTQPPG